LASKKHMKFRNFLAENGVEMAPDQSEKVYKALKNFVSAAKKMSMEELWRVEELSPEYAALYRQAKEI